MDDELKAILENMPDPVKIAVTNYSTHKIASESTGLDEFTFDKIAMSIGTKMAERRNRWRPVADGLSALAELGR
jgi:hypothetical protein